VKVKIIQCLWSDVYGNFMVSSNPQYRWCVQHILKCTTTQTTHCLHSGLDLTMFNCCTHHSTNTE